MSRILLNSDGQYYEVSPEKALAFVNAGLATVAPKNALSVGSDPFPDSARRALEEDFEIGGYQAFLAGVDMLNAKPAEVYVPPDQTYEGPDEDVTIHDQSGAPEDWMASGGAYESVDVGGTGGVPGGGGGNGLAGDNGPNGGDLSGNGAPGPNGVVDFNERTGISTRPNGGISGLENTGVLSLTGGTGDDTLSDASRWLSDVLGLSPDRTVSEQAGQGELGVPGDMLCKALNILDKDHCEKAIGNARLPAACGCPW